MTFETKRERVLVWDLPLRVFHWLLAGSFVGAFVTAESERWRDVHAILGYTTPAMVAFRVLWGVFGTRYARFGALPLAPRRAVSGYIFWALTGTQSFQPYKGETFAPQTINVLIVALLFSLILTGSLLLVIILATVAWTLLKKKDFLLDQKSIAVLYGGVFLYTIITVLFHLFRVIPGVVSLLSFVVFWGIVWYVRYKRKNRFQKYLAKSSRGADGGQADEVRGEQGPDDMGI